MGSNRLPGKILADISGKPMLGHVIAQVKAASTIKRIVVATSDNYLDDSIIKYCASIGVECFRGSELDVLDRYYQAARFYNANPIVRITGDCPLIDPSVIDTVVKSFFESGCDYATNTLRYTYPDGLDTEVFSFEALARAWKEANKQSDREHVTPYIRTSDIFSVYNVENEVDLSSRNLRWTVDEESDLDFVRSVCDNLTDCSPILMNDILGLLDQKPDLLNSNSGAIMNEGYYKSLYSQAIAKAAPRLCLDQSEKWFARSNKTIPGSSQTFSKGYTQYVQGVSPVFLKSGAGCLVWDVDGNEYIDYVQGLLPNILGYANHEVNLAVTQQIAEGHSFSLPHPLEIELAEQLVDLVPCAEMVRFGKNGSDATSGAVRAARAFTGRDRIACCGYHGWQDWYVGTTTRNSGVPEVVQSLTQKFDYNDLDSLSTLLEKHPGEFAAVIMEPVNFVEPDPGYLEGVKELTQLHGALLIFDEICSGFHFGLGGAQKFYGVIPDLACFGKAMGNGFPISCILGKAEVMTVFEEIFFSFTMGGEIASIAAALKVIDILKTTDALETIKSNGKKLQDGLNVMSSEAGLQDCIKCVGHPSWSLIRFSDIADCESAVIRTLFIQELNKRGILSLGAHNMSTSHGNAHIEQTLHTYANVLKTISGWLNETQPESFLEGPIIRPVFQAR
tara:strand:- start:3609 stop:5633 length:2025 start_codon:yes stop_codon:yes gene_type:complete